MFEKDLIISIGSNDFAVPHWLSIDDVKRTLGNLEPVQYLYTKDREELDTDASYKVTKPGELYHTEIEFKEFAKVHRPMLKCNVEPEFPELSLEPMKIDLGEDTPDLSAKQAE